MYSIEVLQERIQKELADLLFNKQPSELYEPINYSLSLGGKRIRPLLVLLGNDLFGGDINKALKPAIGIEVFHNFTLLHDDIMDKAPLRRSMPTVHHKWNEDVAILSGDAMLIEAYRLIMMVEDNLLRRILELFNETAILVCEGQQWDMNYETDKKVSIEDYLKMISLKTAVLLAASFQMGALIAGAEEKDAQLIYDYGKNLGIAFQLQDDILDVYGDKNKFGKQVGGDIISNKKTYLLLKAYQLAEGEDLKLLDHWINKKEFDAEEKVVAVVSVFNSLDIKEKAKAEMQSFYHKAVATFSQINQPKEKKEVIAAFADSLIHREI
jgi:geranylgeranyl diphosphate synthase, type II